MIRLGVDIGGTFTDFVAVESEAGRARVWKRLTTPDDPSQAVIEGLRDLVGQIDGGASEVGVLVHGTTLAANAIIERKGARTALIATEGHRDTIEIGREIRYDIYDLVLDRPPPLVPRALRMEVSERLGPSGEQLRALDPASVRETVERLRDAGVEAVAVCLLHSYANPRHEEQVRQELEQALPGVAVSLSSQVAPEMREYERASTTAGNAYVQPILSRYLERIERSLAASSPNARLSVMLSNGGLTSADHASEVPVQLVESGPAAGVLAACRYADPTDLRNLISFDMGGTTAKMCVVTDGRPTTSHETEVARRARFKKGSGIPLLVPTIDLIEIGAGGGSVARADRLGLLKVGPQSAGAAPGPACYGIGGEEATVTDANLVLGYLDAAAFLGGRMQLDRAAAERALDRLGSDLGIGVVEAARGVHDLVNENMAIAARRHVTDRAEDPARYGLVAFGGGGPLHAYGLARRLGIGTVICPPAAGTASALGCLVAPATVELARSRMARLDDLDWADLEALYAELDAEARATLVSAGVAPDAITIRRWADLRYVGQGFEVPVAVPDDFLEVRDGGRLTAAFTETYRTRFNRWLEGAPVECTTWRLVAAGPEGHVDVAALASGPEAGGSLVGRRPAHFAEAGGFVTCDVHDRYALAVGQRIDGPAIVQERESTTVLGPGSVAVVDESRNLVISVDTRA